MSKSTLTRKIEQALTTYAPASFEDFEINYRRGQYKAFEFPVTHAHIEDGLVDLVWLAEGYNNHTMSSYCSAPRLLKYSKGPNKKWNEEQCGFTTDELIDVGSKNILPCSKDCVYVRSKKTKDEAIAIICFEVKISRSDFHSPNGHNFVGNLNYYVMPYELYKQVKDEVPEGIGVITYHYTDETEVGKLRQQKQSAYKVEIDYPLYNSMLLTVLNKKDKHIKRLCKEAQSYVNTSSAKAHSVISELVKELKSLSTAPECYTKSCLGSCSSCSVDNTSCNNCYFGAIKSNHLHEEIDMKDKFLPVGI